ncbi:MAG: O-antigen ligase family protein [Planctomycetes bacterium]|nr:O-antigen ligase family protein [Planctomycetota bacterium]
MPTRRPPPDRIDVAIEALLSSLAVYLPFAFGGVLAQSTLVLVAAAVVLSLLLVVRNVLLWRSGSLVSGTAIVLPMLGFVGLVLLQFVPLPTSVASLVAKTHVARELALLGDGPVDALRLSLVPYGTLADLRIVLSVCIGFLAAIHVFRHKRAQRRFLTVLSFAGSAVAVLGILQIVTTAKGIYWTYPGGSLRSGPFVHYGHYAQFLNLSIGATIALLLGRMLEGRGKRRLEAEDLMAELRASAHGFERWLAFSLALAIIAIAMSSSRNGVISLGVSGAITVFMMHRSHFVRGVAWPALALLLVSALVLFGFGFDPVIERMETLGDLESASADRVALLGDTMRMIGDSPIVGSGLGSFEYAFPSFDTTMRPGTAAHAENQYAEVLAETGIVGFALVLVTAVLIGRVLVRAARGRRGSMRAAAYGSAFGLIAVAIHATTDFGLRIPAVAWNSAMLAGIGVAAGLRERDTALVEDGAERLPWARTTLVATAVFGLLALWQLPAALRGWSASRAWRQAESLEREVYSAKTLQDVERYDEITNAAHAAAELDPTNIDYRFWSLAHEWRAAVVRAARQSEGSDAERNAARDDATSDNSDNATATGTKGSGEQAASNALHTRNEALTELAHRLVPELLALRSLAPTYGQLWSMAGQLALRYPRNADDRANGVAWIRRGFEVAPQHPATCLAIAELSLEDPEASTAKTTGERASLFRRALRMGVRWTRVLQSVLAQQRDIELAHEIAKGNPTMLSDLARRVEQVPEFADRATAIRTDAFAIWRRQVDDGTLASAGALVSLAREADRTENNEDAIRFYGQYLRTNYASPERVRLAVVLGRVGKWDEATRELQVVLNQNPLNRQAKALLVEYEKKRIEAKMKTK